MKKIVNGWVIINYNHPNKEGVIILEETFATTRKYSIKKFLEYSGYDWIFWKKNFNYSVAKCLLTLETKE